MDLPARQRGTRVPNTGMDPERRGPVLVAQTPQTESASRWTRTQFSATSVLHCISLWPGGDWYPPPGGHAANGRRVVKGISYPERQCLQLLERMAGMVPCRGHKISPELSGLKTISGDEDSLCSFFPGAPSGDCSFRLTLFVYWNITGDNVSFAKG